MVQHSNIDHTGVTGVPASLSYASNSNSVAIANQPGASTSVSRADHVHLGVRSIAHTSNTFSGPVTLTASGIVGITSPAAGTFDITASATGGGGGGAAGSVTFAGARVTRSATKTISNNTATVVDFNSEGSGGFDTAAFHDTVTNNTRLTVPTDKAGKYRIYATIDWSPNGTGFRQIYLYLNGATIIGIDQVAAFSGDQLRQSVATTYDLAASDYVEVYVRQTSGGALDLNAVGNFAPVFGLDFLGS